MTFTEFNQLDSKILASELLQCCSSKAWLDKLISFHPFDDQNLLKQQADHCWQNLTEQDYLQAFEGHPTIGDVSTLREKYQSTKALASGEQSGVDSATEQTLQRLKQFNDEYHTKFGFIFIVCATGKTAGQMLLLLSQRLKNSRAEELVNAAEEQRKIFQLRITKMLQES